MSFTTTPLLRFDSSAFPIEPGEDEETNPGLYGKALATWLGERLRARGFGTRAVFGEDFGWLVPVESRPHSLYVACVSVEPDHWQLYAFAEGGWIARLLGRDRRAEQLSSLFAAVRRCLEEAPEIRNLSEEQS